ncbi:hypothetical protein GCM10011428_48730 [Streptomyces violaceus]
MAPAAPAPRRFAAGGLLREGAQRGQFLVPPDEVTHAPRQRVRRGLREPGGLGAGTGGASGAQEFRVCRVVQLQALRERGDGATVRTPALAPLHVTDGAPRHPGGLGQLLDRQPTALP